MGRAIRLCPPPLYARSIKLAGLGDPPRLTVAPEWQVLEKCRKIDTMSILPGPQDLICSARGCENAATHAVLWRNPALPRKRHKTWLACTEHQAFLEKYLGYRQFPTRVVPISQVDTATLDPADS